MVQFLIKYYESDGTKQQNGRRWCCGEDNHSGPGLAMVLFMVEVVWWRRWKWSWSGSDFLRFGPIETGMFCADTRCNLSVLQLNWCLSQSSFVLNSITYHDTYCTKLWPGKKNSHCNDLGIKTLQFQNWTKIASSFKNRIGDNVGTKIYIRCFFLSTTSTNPLIATCVILSGMYLHTNQFFPVPWVLFSYNIFSPWIVLYATYNFWWDLVVVYHRLLGLLYTYNMRICEILCCLIYTGRKSAGGKIVRLLNCSVYEMFFVMCMLLFI